MAGRNTCLYCNKLYDRESTQCDEITEFEANFPFSLPVNYIEA